MERKVKFEEGEHYHLYTRGVEKRVVFTTNQDSERFLILLLCCNDSGSVRIRSDRGEPSVEWDKKRDTLVDILAYALMPNHIHLIVREKRAGGISKFMLKLMTAYSMYFNTKYRRSGPLFTRPFRSKHIDSDEYFRWVFAYVHLNPLELFQPEWREKGLLDAAAAGSYLQTYRYGSFPDYFVETRAESRILSKETLPIELHELQTMDDLLAELSNAPIDTKSLIYY